LPETPLAAEDAEGAEKIETRNESPESLFIRVYLRFHTRTNPPDPALQSLNTATVKETALPAAIFPRV
jgi:hypothetical protein